MNPSQVVLISGCSSGIGLALAQRLVVAGATVYAGLRDLRQADALPGAKAIRLDVTRPEEITAAVAHIEQEAGRLDTLINNAGVHAIGPWEVVPTQIVRQVFEVNFFGALELTRSVLPVMRRQREGIIVMVSSLSAQVALPGSGVYSASKFALEAFAESLAYEVRPWNIHIKIMSPGGYRTGLDARAWRSAVADGPYALMQAQLMQPGGSSSGDAEDAAERIIQALQDKSEQLHYPLDETARLVFKTLKHDSESEREHLLRAASGLGWWIDRRE